MQRNHGPEDKPPSVLALCGRALEETQFPESRMGRIVAWQQLEELSSASATVRTRLEVALVLSRVPTPTSGVGTSPMASEAFDRLLLAVNNVLALRDT